MFRLFQTGGLVTIRGIPVAWCKHDRNDGINPGEYHVTHGAPQLGIGRAVAGACIYSAGRYFRLSAASCVACDRYLMRPLTGWS